MDFIPRPDCPVCHGSGEGPEIVDSMGNKGPCLPCYFAPEPSATAAAVRLRDVKPEHADYLPRLPARMLWETDRWDGPMAGVAEHNGERLFFTFADARDARDEDVPPPHYRRFWLVRMTPEQRAFKERWHARFQAEVGTHCDYEPLNGHTPGTCHRRESERFYRDRKVAADPDFRDNEVVGFFDW